MKRWSMWSCCLLWLIAVPLVQAEDAPTIYPIAVFPFQERGDNVADLGGKVTDLLFANLVAREQLYLVEREDLKKILEEQELSVAGLTDPQQSNRVGRLTGARILVTGSVFQVGDKLYVVAKLIGTESSKVYGASVKGKATDDLDTLINELAGSVAGKISQQGGELIPQAVEEVDRLAALNKALGDAPRPKLWIEVRERHAGQSTPDPAAETELTKLCTEAGFVVIDHAKGSKSDADVLLVGEGISQFAARHGNLVSVKARLELKAVARESSQVLAADRQTTVKVDLAELIAAKTAMQEAAADIAGRLIPQAMQRLKPAK